MDDDEAEGEMLDMQTLLLVVVGAAVLCLLIMCKVCCNRNVAYTAVSNDLQTDDDDDEYHDERPAGYSDEKGEATETESNHSFVIEPDSDDED